MTKIRQLCKVSCKIMEIIEPRGPCLSIYTTLKMVFVYVWKEYITTRVIINVHILLSYYLCAQTNKLIFFSLSLIYILLPYMQTVNTKKYIYPSHFKF